MGAPRGGFEQSGPFQRFARQRGNASLELFTKLALPPAKGVRPGFDCVFVDGVLVEGADAAPAVVVDEGHGRFVPVILSENAPLQESGHDIVPIFEDVRFHHKVFADHALDRVTSAVNERLQILDDGSGKGPRHGP